MSAPTLPPSHPLARMYPLLQGNAFDALVADVRAHGLMQPITLIEGLILDGRNRYRACLEAGVPARTVQYTGDDPLAFVKSANQHRRHLTESQIAMIVAEQETVSHGGARRGDQAATVHLDRAALAREAGISPRIVASAKTVRVKAIPAIVDAVRSGAMPVSLAAQVAALPQARQHQVAAEIHNGRSLSTIVLSATRRERVEAIERQAQHVPLSALGRTFPVIYADPPWRFEAWSEGGQLKAPDMHYQCMSTDDICAVPVADIAARDSVLFMWALPAMLPDALSVVSAWGFTFKTFAVWVKPGIGCGKWFRGQHEPLIVASRGTMPPPPELHSSVYFEGSTSGRHSEKPDSVRDWIAEAYPEAGRIELFARAASPGWVAWGNQSP